MKTVQKTVWLGYSAKEMFDLVCDVEHYPEFLPGCAHAKVLETHDDGVTAELGLALMGVHKAFVTRNTHIKNQRLDMSLVKGPFSHLEGHWKFTDFTAQAGEHACRVDFALEYRFEHGLLESLIGPVFDKFANSFVESFITRAQTVYGKR